MQYFQGAKEFLITHFSAIVLSLGLLFIISSTLDINTSRKPTDPKDKLNTYYGLNVTSIVFLSLYIGNQYIFPHLVNNGVHQL